MRFGRRNKKDAVTEDDVTDATPDATSGDDVTAGQGPVSEDGSQAAVSRADGPWDASELEVPDDDPSYIDLGGLIIKGRVGFDLQIPTDPASGDAGSVVFVAEDSAVELRAFAAARSGGLWDEVRAEIVEEVGSLRGEVEEVDGPFGKELQIQVPVEAPDGEQSVQPSRIVGVDGPRWLLRGTFMGRAALNPDPEGVLESAFRDVVVVRGTTPMAPREQIPVVLPEGAVPIDTDEA